MHNRVTHNQQKKYTKQGQKIAIETIQILKSKLQQSSSDFKIQMGYVSRKKIKI